MTREKEWKFYLKHWQPKWNKRIRLKEKKRMTIKENNNSYDLNSKIKKVGELGDDNREEILEACGYNFADEKRMNKIYKENQSHGPFPWM